MSPCYRAGPEAHTPSDRYAVVRPIGASGLGDRGSFGVERECQRGRSLSDATVQVTPQRERLRR